MSDFMITPDPAAVINVGKVTSYADAVAGGYQGTREEWEIVLANLGTTAAEVEANRQAVAEDKAAVEGDVTTVGEYKDVASAAAAAALQSAESAHTDALAATAAKEAAQTAQGIAEEARADAVSAKGAAESAQTEANASASAAAGSALAAQDAAETATTQAGAASDSATAAAQSAEAAAESARTLTVDTTLTQAGQAADAKKVGDEVTDLKSALTLEKRYIAGYPENYSIVASLNTRIVYAPCIGEATYIVSKMNTSRFSVFFLEEAPKNGAVILNDGYVSDYNATTLRTKAPKNAKYIGAYVWHAGGDPEIPADDAVNSTVITQISALDSVARNELESVKRSADNNFDYANPFNKYIKLFEQKGYSAGSYVYSNNRISITEPFTPEKPIYIKAKEGYLFTTSIWENDVIKNNSGWRSETVLTPGLYYTISVKKDDESDILPSESNNIIGNIFEQNSLWDTLKDGKKVYKGEYIIGAPVLSGDKYYIDYSATKRLTFPVPLYVKAGSVVKIVANGQGFFSARFREFDGTYLSEYIDGATTRYNDYVWNIDENSYIYVVFRTVSGNAITPEELTGSVELYEDYAYMSNRYGVIRNIFDDKAYDTRSKVRDLLTEPCLVFPLVTDIHDNSITRLLYSNFEQMIDNITNLARYVHCDFLLNLGDNTDGDEVANTLRRNDYMLSRFMHVGIPYYQAIGNHDTNYSTKTGAIGNTRLTMGETYRSYLSATKDIIVNANNFTDYYTDFDWCGVRLVVINSNYMDAYAFSASTAQWLSDTALNTSHIVILATHLSPISSQNWNNNNPTNSADVASAIQTFVTNGGTVIQLCGHSHADYSFTSPWLCVFSDCQKLEKADLSGEGYQKITGYDSLGIIAPDRTAGTATEDSWSVVVLRPNARKINFVRFGAGNDREYSF